MSVFDYLWDHPLRVTHVARRGRRFDATLEARIAQLEVDVCELETALKTLIAVVREAGVMTDDRVLALLQLAIEDASRASDPAGERLERRPRM
jgi:hypothetical protein